MNFKKTAAITGSILGGAAAAAAWLTAPGRTREGQRSPFCGKYIAHRGLYNNESGVPENSLKAFRAAADAGFGAEMDARMTSDGEIVVCHDGNVQRMTGENLNIADLKLSAVQQLCLKGTEEHIPLLKDALKIFADAGLPVILEIKPQDKWEDACAKVLAIMDDFGDLICIESFDPRIVGWFRKNAPDILRGQLISQPEDMMDGDNKLMGFAISHGLTAFMARPQFIAHRLGEKCLPIRFWDKAGQMKVCWTARSPMEPGKYDTVIFEGFVPVSADL